MLDSDICHKKAIEILQNARGHIELIVAKGKSDTDTKQVTTSDYSMNADHPAPIDKSLNNLNLSSNSLNGVYKSDNEQQLNQYLQNEPGLDKFSQIELIELVNTGGKGLGFGILGGKSKGCHVRTILPGGVSDKVGEVNNKSFVKYYVTYLPSLLNKTYSVL